MTGKKIKNLAIYVGAAVAAVAVAGFAQDTPPDFSQDAAWHNRQQIALAELQPGDGWYNDDGLRWRYVEGSGQGKRPKLTDRVTVHYAGTLVDGTEFDSSYARGEPVTFPLGRLITAWQMAIPNMAVGDTVEIVAPSDLAYGPRGKGEIPGGATLKFKVELLGIE